MSDNRIDIASLSLPQLYDIKKQLQAELDHLADSFQKLRQAQSTFQSCADTVDTVSSQEEGTEVLVPLTSSLYVPGKVADVNTFMVDVGTGYYVEKNAQDSKKFYEKKVATLNSNTKELEMVVQGKMENMRVIDEALKMRYTEEQQKTAKK